MNYNDWYKTMPGLGQLEEAVAGVAWRACKAATLKIVENEKIYFMPDNDMGYYYLDRDNLIEKLKNL